MVFTYQIADQVPVIGGGVPAPFIDDQLSGLVTAFHHPQPAANTTLLLDVLDCGLVMG